MQARNPICSRQPILACCNRAISRYNLVKVFGSGVVVVSPGVLLIACGSAIILVSVLVRLLEPRSEAKARAAKRRQRSSELVARLSRDVR